MGTLKTVILTTTALGAAVIAGTAAVVYSGIYNIAATSGHTQLVYSFLETAMRQSVKLRAGDVVPPPLDDEELVQKGIGWYKSRCVQCHGAPGVAQDDIGMSMYPVPGPLINATRHWEDRELYWLTKHGILMSGMPAWKHRMADRDLWAIVAFLRRLPKLTPQQYAAMAADAAPPSGKEPSSAGQLLTGDAGRGKAALSQYACIACHTIPGTSSSDPHVGPPLGGIAKRVLIAGKLPNTLDNMVRWLRHTREIDPLTAMPDMGVSEQDAIDIASYLATLD